MTYKDFVSTERNILDVLNEGDIIFNIETEDNYIYLDTYSKELKLYTNPPEGIKCTKICLYKDSFIAFYKIPLIESFSSSEFRSSLLARLSSNSEDIKNIEDRYLFLNGQSLNVFVYPEQNIVGVIALSGLVKFSNEKLLSIFKEVLDECNSVK